MPPYAGHGRRESVIVGDETREKALVYQLVTLLDEQIASAAMGHFEHMESLMEASSGLALEIAKTRARDDQASQVWQEQIVRRYKRLELTLASAKEITKDKLRHVQISKKMLAVYRGSNR
ncbi:MAG: hypothetical protein K9N55_00625 [Phycisphaerae bacterium]|nr:hypothetical protein [Phycisphaerae bacterium]